MTLIAILSFVEGAGPEKYSWRYYRPGNTGIQGDFNESIWIAPDGNPWIAGYNPVAEEGGVAKFLRAQNRWINVSNIDYPVIGSANEVGFVRISDIIADGQGNLWMGTWRGVLRMNLASGPKSLVRFGPGNSALPGGLTRDMTLAPDGSIWVSAESTIWGGGGLTRYNPATKTWSHMNGRGGGKIAAQPKPGGGYYIWTSAPGLTAVERWDSTTNSWTSFAPVPGNPAHLQSLDSVDTAGNLWITRWYGNQNQERLDCLRPDGTWVSPQLPPENPQVPVAALRAFGNMQVLMVDGYSRLQKFDGLFWTDLGLVPHDGFIDDLDIDDAGNVWLSGTGTGGAVRRDATTGIWQRYRITNTSQFDLFNNDLSIDPLNGDVYATANAGTGIGGMVRFDGVRWSGFNQYTYGLGQDWPFQTDNSDAVYVRPSNRRVVVNPTSHYSFDWDGTNWTSVAGGPDQVQNYVEDSLGRLWGTGHYGGLGIYENGGYTFVSSGDWFSSVKKDPSRAGTVWSNLGWEILRTDGNYRFSRSPGNFQSNGLFTGMAVQPDGVAWVGIWSQFVSTGSVLVRIDPTTGNYQAWRYDEGWPFPGEHVRPQIVTPDGRVWMTYDSEYPSTDMGLLWWDGSKMGVFPAPPNGEWRWGGLPHANIKDIEVKIIPGGYELWMSCMSRGIAVLTVQKPIAKQPKL
ncbi:MAG: two-component regulator propeller domain-containing protein [Fimbriimonadaceae bacterium]